MIPIGHMEGYLARDIRLAHRGSECLAEAQAEQARKVAQAPAPLDLIECVTHVQKVRIINREIDIFGVINSLNTENSIKEWVRKHFEAEREREERFANE